MTSQEAVATDVSGGGAIDSDGVQSNYQRLRGKCKEMAEAAALADPGLRVTRGHYYCPIWNTGEAHWWCVRQDGTIYDPTAKQFPSAGLGQYVEFSGTHSCEQCGKTVRHSEAKPYGRFVFCSDTCIMRCVGL